jgi:hypothetical protein
MACSRIAPLGTVNAAFGADDLAAAFQPDGDPTSSMAGAQFERVTAQRTDLIR